MGNDLKMISISQGYLDRNFYRLKNQAGKENILYVVLPDKGVYIKSTDFSGLKAEITLVYTENILQPSRQVKILLFKMHGIYSIENENFLE